MEKIQAQHIIKDALQNPFDKGKFFYFIKNLLNKVDESKAFQVRGYVPEMFKQHIKTYERLATYTDPEDNKIDILVVYLQKETTLEKARSLQRNFMARYLKDRDQKDAGLVAFVSPNYIDWRFSLVKMEYKFEESKDDKIKVKEEFTPAKRWSFLVGANENSHTAQKQFVSIIESENQITTKQLEEAFNIEKVTKEFFEKYRGLFLQLQEMLEDLKKKDTKIRQDFNQKNVKIEDFAKKLLGQIVFLYFLQKKGWFGVDKDKNWGEGNKKFLRTLFDQSVKRDKNYFNDYLEPLFYEALAKERDEDFYSRFECRIPFLNGGLFDPINGYDWVNTNINLPNEVFSNTRKTKEGDKGDGILDIFDRYNFTVKEDEPLEKEVAVDPEMLGKVFENLLEIKDRKSKGTYYTPREIVHYMCQQSLINYLSSNSDIDKEKLNNLMHFDEILGQKMTKDKKKRYMALWEGEKDVIDQVLDKIKIVDPACGSGAFLVGMMHEIINLRKILNQFFKANNLNDYQLKLSCIQNNLYGVDIDQGAVEIAKLRLWLSLIVDEEDIKAINPLPNLDYKIVCGNSLLSVEKNLFNSNLFEELEKLKPLFFSETNGKKKKEYKKHIDELINKITKGHKEFDFEIYFSEVFHEKGGFGVVIGNPPYVKEYINKSAFNRLRNSSYYQGKMDLWYMFACRGIDLVRDEGVVTFIAQNNWVTSYGASKMRDKVIRDAQILALLDFGDFKVFETAGIQTMVMIFKKDKSQDKYKFDYRKIISSKPVLDNIIALLNRDNNKNCQYLNPLIDRKKILGKSLVFSDSETESVLSKIAQASNFKLKAGEVANGIHHHHDCVDKKRSELLNNKYKVGNGIFVISNEELKNLKLSPKEKSLLKPSYTTTELKRWYSNKINKEWVIYTDSSFRDGEKIKRYPKIKEHLDKFKKVITSDNGPYGLHRARDERFFKDEKIIALRKCINPIFTYVTFDSYVSATFYVIKINRVNQKYLTALLNSKLVAFWLKHKGKMQGNNYQIDKEPILDIPLIDANKQEQKRINEIVDQILKKKKENPKADTSDLEKEIDKMVYDLYELTGEEIKIIEKNER